MKQMLIITVAIVFFLGIVCAGTVSAKATSAPSVQSGVKPAIAPVAANTPNEKDEWQKNHKTYTTITSAKVMRVISLGKNPADNSVSTIDEYWVVIEGYLKEQVGNKPQPNTDPGVKNTPVDLTVRWRDSTKQDTNYPSEHIKEFQVRTAWWDGSGWFKFDVLTHTNYWPALAFLLAGLFEPDDMQYKVRFEGYLWRGFDWKGFDHWYEPYRAGWTDLPPADVRYG